MPIKTPKNIYKKKQKPKNVKIEAGVPPIIPIKTLKN